MVAAPGGFFDIEGKAVLAAVEVTDVGDAQVDAQEVGADREVRGVESDSILILPLLELEHLLAVEAAKGGEADLLPHGILGGDVEAGFGFGLRLYGEADVNNVAVVPGLLRLESSLDKGGVATLLEWAV